MTKNTYYCDECRSLDANGALIPEADRQNSANFKRYRIEVIGPNGMPMMEDFTICNTCAEKENGFAKKLEAMLVVLRANKAAI